MRKGNLKEANRNFDMALQAVSGAKLQTAEIKIERSKSYANKGFCRYLYNINKPQMHDAVNLMRQAIDIVEDNLHIKNEILRKQSVQVLINIKSRLGGIYNSLKEYAKALSLENEAEALMQNISEQDNTSFCNSGLINMEKGHAYMRLNQLRKAKELFASAKTIFDKAMIGDQWVRLRMQETEVLVRLNELTEAYKNCEDVFKRGNREQNDYNELFFNTCHYNAGVIKYKQKDIKASLKHFRDYANGMKVFCKRFLRKEEYDELFRSGAFDLIYNEKHIKKCFQNALKIFTVVCMDGSEFITDYVRQNFSDVAE
jgi:tetratricopeptide (TPR) repeat protein